MQIDQFESEIEGIVSKKKKLDREVSVEVTAVHLWSYKSYSNCSCLCCSQSVSVDRRYVSLLIQIPYYLFESNVKISPLLTYLRPGNRVGLFW